MVGKEPAVLKKKMAASSSDEDSDVERNFALLTEKREGGTGAGGGGAAEEEEEFSDDDYEGASDDDGEEEEELAEEGSDDDGEEEEEEEDGDGGTSEEEDDDEEEEEEQEQQEEAGSSKIQTRDDIKKELSNMSFEDIMKLQNKVGTKVYNEVAYGSSRSERSVRRRRLNKNRPMEVSAKKPAPFLRQVVPVRKPTLRDPRFDDLSGEYKPEIFEKTYKFIDDIRLREKKVLQKQLRKTKSNSKKEKLQFLLKRMENQERARASQEEQRQQEQRFRREQRERAGRGAAPFYLKSSEKKKLQLAEKFQQLKKSGKLENFLSKKRKRNAGKDRRKLPATPH